MITARVLLLALASIGPGHGAPPRWDFPRPGSYLCPAVLLQASGVDEALDFSAGLHVVASFDGTILPDDMVRTLHQRPLHTIDGVHTVSLEIVNRTTDGENHSSRLPAGT